MEKTWSCINSNKIWNWIWTSSTQLFFLFNSHLSRWTCSYFSCWSWDWSRASYKNGSGLLSFLFFKKKNFQNLFFLKNEEMNKNKIKRLLQMNLELISLEFTFQILVPTKFEFFFFLKSKLNIEIWKNIRLQMVHQQLDQ